MELLKNDIFLKLAIFLITLSIICQIVAGVLYQSMIQETDNMSATNNKLLKQCKLKFANCYQLNSGVANISVFVDKFMNRIKIGILTLPGLSNFSGQMILLSVLLCGIGIYRSIVNGRHMIELFPYYIVSLFGLYAYFSISSFVDIKNKREILKTNIIDYLENHMVNRLKVLPRERIAKEIMEAEMPEQETPKFGRKEKQELEQLLQEFLS
ncbi:MAG: hypothetical protein E7284_11025 [Lachnospiraceae bacterium]|nr:hypothetical protein [Lachnospiraceae bacterium]